MMYIFVKAFHECFGGDDSELNYVDFEVNYKNTDIVRTTKIRRDGLVVQSSNATAIRRS
jgi:hypothetical protein